MKKNVIVGLLMFAMTTAIAGEGPGKVTQSPEVKPGAGATKDYAQDVLRYRKAADKGDAAAQYNLGVLYANGRGVPKDGALAAQWYRKAADQGNVLAKEKLESLR